MSDLEPFLRLAEAGYPLAPIRVRRRPDGRKRTWYLTEWGASATTDPDQITAWWQRYGEGVGFLIACQPAGIVVVDLDLKPPTDAMQWWGQEGLPVSPMTVDTPSGGQHHYWRQPPTPIPNSSAAIAPGVDIRGVGGQFGGLVHAPGTVVLGGDGHEAYVLLDRLVAAADLPELPTEVIERIPETRRRRSAKARGPAAQGKGHQLSWIQGEVTRLADVARGLPAKGGHGHRAALMGAAMMAGRLAAADDRPRETAEDFLREIPIGVWGSVSADDEEWIQTGLDDGEADPYTITPEHDDPADEESDPDAYQDALSKEVLRERVRRDARAVLAAEDRAPLVRLTPSEFLARPRPTYLVPEMLYRDALSVVFGPPGAAKSFFVLDLALHLAAGIPWRGLELGQHRVHYVMAEGDAVNANRTDAWLLHHDVDPGQIEDHLVVFPEGVLLTDVGVAQYLHDVATDEPSWIILDTKNAMMEGNESIPADVAVMRRALDQVRRVCGSAVTLVDHTGLMDDSRARGSNAQKAALGTEVRISQATGGVRVAEVTRDKSGVEGAAWAFTLQGVPGARKVGDRPEVVPVAHTIGEGGVTNLYGDEDWRDVVVPEDVRTWQESAKGGSPMIARVAQFMIHHASGPSGVSLAEVTRSLATDYPDVPADRLRMRVKRSWDALHEMGRLRSVAPTGTNRTTAHNWVHQT